MSKIDKKLEQIKLQHEIGEILRKDNGVSCHFDYHVNLLSDYETIKLNLLTYNKRHDEYMLLHSVKGTSSIDCLEKMKTFLTQHSLNAKEHSFTVKWTRSGDDEKHVSYFFGTSEKEVREKFLHEKDASQYHFEIIQNPVS